MELKVKKSEIEMETLNSDPVSKLATSIPEDPVERGSLCAQVSKGTNQRVGSWRQNSGCRYSTKCLFFTPRKSLQHSVLRHYLAGNIYL